MVDSKMTKQTQLERNIHRKLGLMHPNTFSNFHFAENQRNDDIKADEVYRQTGRTTQLLIGAILAALEGGNVYLVPNTPTRQASLDLTNKLLSMLCALEVVFSAEEERTIRFGFGKIVSKIERPTGEDYEGNYFCYQDEL